MSRFGGGNVEFNFEHGEFGVFGQPGRVFPTSSVVQGVVRMEAVD